MCYRPITIKVNDRYIQVPCGRCLDCLRQKQNDWSIRLYEEYKARGCKGVFFTLTYDEQHVPKNYLVDQDIFRSHPDYGYSCLLPKRGESFKISEFPYACLLDFGLDRHYEKCLMGDFIDFNAKRSPSKHKALRLHFQKLFAEYFSLFTSPLLSKPIYGLTEDDVDDWFNVDLLNEDLLQFYKVDEYTGELLPRSKYSKPTASVGVLRERPIVSFNSVRKEDVQLWLKRCRSRLFRSGVDVKWSYFITSEYGPSTLRPHYHGCIFGLSKSEIKSWFEDWQQHYGEIVQFDDLDMSKGGLSYVSKYCSKGSFEHPLCAKDFFYFYRRASSLLDVYCSEYHSKHYERCIDWFGIDAPIVDPTFHLVSKGLGVDWCKKDIPRLKESDVYFNAPDIGFHDVRDVISYRDGLITRKIEHYVDKEKQKKFQEWEQSTQSMDEWLRLFKDRCCYKRTLHSSEGEKTFTFRLPKYYRAKMFSDALRASYSNFIQSESDELYRQKLRQMGAFESSREMPEAVMAIEAESNQKLIDRFNKCFDRFTKFYKKSKL